jgi:hypothetical protein
MEGIHGAEHPLCVEIIRHGRLERFVSRTAAQEFMESEGCQIRMPRRTVYTHLEKWRKTRRIPPRKHRPKVKYKKSEGLMIRSFSQH